MLWLSFLSDVKRVFTRKSLLSNVKRDLFYWRVSPINSCHTLLVSDTISESDNTATTSNSTTLHFTPSSVCSESARCLTYQSKPPLSHKISLGGFIYILFSS